MDTKQQMLLEEFFKKKKTYEDVLAQFIAVLFIVIPMVIWIMPCQIWGEDNNYKLWLMLFCLEWFGFTFYLRKFNMYIEDRQIKLIDEVIKYLPISYKELARFRLKKLAKACVWPTGISMFCQTVFAIAFLHTFSGWNILIPLIYNFIFPVLLVGSKDIFKAV